MSSRSAHLGLSAVLARVENRRARHGLMTSGANSLLLDRRFEGSRSTDRGGGRAAFVSADAKDTVLDAN
jgi:hypothetical protein